LALAALTLLRLIVAATVPLTPDEAYYWVRSRVLAPGYPDHPPMVALWIRLGTSVAGDGPLGVRLLAPLSLAVASLLIADAGDRLLPDRHAGIRAAALLNATLLFGVGGVLMTPDAPLLAFWTASLWSLARLLDSGHPGWWFAAGLFAGLAMVSKYTAGLLWFGIAAWPLISPSARRWLRHPAPWIAALLAAGIFLPVVIWDAGHGWASFARQGGRMAAWHPWQAMRFVAELIGGQAGLVTPLVFVLCGAGVIEATRRSWRTRDPAWTLLAALTLPSVVLFTEHALGDRVQGNWPAVIYPAAAIAAGALRKPRWQRLSVPAIALGFGLTGLAYLQAWFGVLPLPARDDPIARQIAGWDALAAEVDAARRQTGAGFVAADQYGVAAELARELPRGVTVAGVQSRWAQFGFSPGKLAGQAGILVHSSRRAGEVDLRPWSAVVPAGVAERRRGADTVEVFQLYRVDVPRDSPAAVILPRPPPRTPRPLAGEVAPPSGAGEGVSTRPEPALAWN
jgi:4-amino-4-deoxy-L-arabinose transferase-like glycosyltransferase